MLTDRSQLFAASKDIAIVSYPDECTASSQQPWGEPLELVYEKLAGPSSLLHPDVMTDISAFMHWQCLIAEIFLHCSLQLSCC